jgi:dTDP-4-dehydrorhamnose reductase/SAM-dependent methyltransferase
VGADSALGNALMQHLSAGGHNVVGTTRRRDTVDETHLFLDLTASPETWSIPEDIGYAVLCAARPKLADCRANPDASYRVNVDATTALARQLSSVGVYVVYPSTNLVFSGQRASMPANSKPDPHTEYGRQKAATECALLALAGPVLCLRITKIFTDDNPLFDTWVRALRGGTSIAPFRDKVDAPVPLSYVVLMIQFIIEHKPTGILQISGSRDISYESMARIGARVIGADESLIEPTTTAAQGYDGNVPENTSLDTHAIVRLSGIEVPDVEETVASAFAAAMRSESVGALARCHICGGVLSDVAEYDALMRVTSDCKLWPAGGYLGVCQECGCVQKRTDEIWQTEVDQIYREYAIYHQGGGSEQRVFQDSSSLPRSDAIVQQLQSHLGLPPVGRLLDFGCGNGAFLRGFSTQFPGWLLEGAELDEKHHQEVMRIPGVGRFHVDSTCSSIEGLFDLISLVHVLEHVVDPVKMLESLRGKLAPGGRLLVQVPSWECNPFDLVIADHCTHFTTDSLANVGRRAGLQPLDLEAGWVSKEISLVFSTADSSNNNRQCNPEASVKRAQRAVRWLDDTWRAASAHCNRTNFGLFGTSIAATWLYGQLHEEVGFFVDEAPERVGRDLLGRPVVDPGGVDEGGLVFVGMSPSIVEPICRRLAGFGVDYIAPPKLPTWQTPSQKKEG